MFENLIKQVTKVIHRYEERGERPSEEATKHALVLPFIRDVLGADYLNPEEVIPEFTADIGERKGEKVDYAICRADKPVILIECKALYSALDNAATVQLERYVNSRLDVNLGILTNGRHYCFYADLDKPNVLDAEPFLSVDLMELTPGIEERMKLFHLDQLDVERIKQEGQGWKAVTSLVQALENEWKAPSDGYVTHFARPLHKKGSLTESVRRQYSGYLKEAHQIFLSRHIDSTSTSDTESDVNQETKRDHPDNKLSAVASLEGWRPLTELEVQTSTLLQQVRFADGSHTDIETWQDLVEVVALKLDGDGHFYPEVPNELSRIVYQDPAENLKRSLKLSNGLVTNLNLNNKGALDRAKRLLKACGYNPAEVYVK